MSTAYWFEIMIPPGYEVTSWGRTIQLTGNAVEGALVRFPAALINNPEKVLYGPFSILDDYPVPGHHQNALQALLWN